jgi:hypothetical protein
VLTAYAAGILFPTEGEIRRLDGLSGNAAPLRERLAWKLGWITHGKDDHLLDLPQVQTRLKAPPDAIVTHPESGLTGSLFDCPDIPLAPGGACLRLIVATHPTTRHSRSRWDHP